MHAIDARGSEDAQVVRIPVAPGPEALEFRQNGVGDVVLPVERGEVVVLPRLWDLDLAEVDAHGALLRSPKLTVNVVFEDDSAVVVEVDSDTLSLRDES